MLFHIQCLREILFLCVIVFPSAYIYFLKPFIQIRGNTLLSENISTVIVYGSLTVLGLTTETAGIINPAPAASFPLQVLISAAIAAAFINIAVEYLEAALPITIKTKKLPKVKPAAIYCGSFNLINLCSIVAAAALEEFVFRQYMIGGLLDTLSVSPFAAVLLSAVFYGMNHVYFGVFAVLQKFSSGLVFSLLFVFGGGNILLCIICHALQNLILYFYSVSKFKGGAK